MVRIPGEHWHRVVVRRGVLGIPDPENTGQIGRLQRVLVRHLVGHGIRVGRRHSGSEALIERARINDFRAHYEINNVTRVESL